MRLLTSDPIKSRRRVNMISGITAKGSPKLRTTWLRIKTRVGLKPRKMTSNEGAIVTERRIQPGMLWCKNPCMITWPAIVPTDEEESPEASSEMANTQLDALPSSGSSVKCASSMVAIWVSPV